MYQVLNVTDSSWHTQEPHCGSIGHVCPFIEALSLAKKYNFDGVNVDINFLHEHGVNTTNKLFEQYQLRPGAFPFSVKFHSEIPEDIYQQSIETFTRDAQLADGVGCHRTVMYIPPSSNKYNYYQNFEIMSRRLSGVRHILQNFNIKVGLEFIGAHDARKTKKYDFIHTIDGVKSLISASRLEGLAGLKFDSHHWYTSGSSLLDIEKLEVGEILYVELNDALPNLSAENQPEFDRLLPATTGMIDVFSILQVLQHKGYDGPVVAEPWSIDIANLDIDTAAQKVKESLNKSFGLINSFK